MALEIIDGVYQIRTAEDFIEFRNGAAGASNIYRRAKQLNDIDLSEFTLSRNQHIDNIMWASYDGSGFVINNAKGGAIFGVARGIFRNVHARNANIVSVARTSDGALSGIGGFISAPGRESSITMSNCSFEGFVRSNIGNTGSGGFVGSAYTTHLTDCHFKGVIHCDAAIGVGGLIGWTGYGSLRRCSTDGSVMPYSGNTGGGLIGRAGNHLKFDIIDCSSSVDIADGDTVGGLVGIAHVGTFLNIDRCIVSGSIRTNRFGAGLVGMGNRVDASNCFILSPTISYAGSDSDTHMLSDTVAYLLSGGKVNMENNTALDTIEFLGA